MTPKPENTLPRLYSDLRSARWFAPDDVRSFGHRSRVMQLGYGSADWVGKPVIAILHLAGYEYLPWASQAAYGGHKARGVAGGWVSAGVSCAFTERADHESDHPAVAQLTDDSDEGRKSV